MENLKYMLDPKEFDDTFKTDNQILSIASTLDSIERRVKKIIKE